MHRHLNHRHRFKRHTVIKVLGKRFLQFFQLIINTFCCCQRIAARCLVHEQVGSALPIHKRIARIRELTQLQPSHIFQVYNSTGAWLVLYNDILELSSGTQSPVHDKAILKHLRILLRRHSYRTCGHLHILCGQRGIYVVCRKAVFGQLIRLQPHTHTEVIRSRKYISHTRQAQQRVPYKYVGVVIYKGHIMAAIGRIQRHQHQYAWITFSYGKAKTLYHVRQLWRGYTYTVLYIQCRYINVSAYVESYIYCQRTIICTIALQILHSRRTIDLRFHRRGHRLLHR